MEPENIVLDLNKPSEPLNRHLDDEDLLENGNPHGGSTLVEPPLSPLTLSRKIDHWQKTMESENVMLDNHKPWESLDNLDKKDPLGHKSPQGDLMSGARNSGSQGQTPADKLPQNKPPQDQFHQGQTPQGKASQDKHPQGGQIIQGEPPQTKRRRGKCRHGKRRHAKSRQDKYPQDKLPQDKPTQGLKAPGYIARLKDNPRLHRSSGSLDSPLANTTSLENTESPTSSEFLDSMLSMDSAGNPKPRSLYGVLRSQATTDSGKS